MKKLQKLNARGNCGIDQNGINGLNLIKLDAAYNPKIIDVSFMKKLQILYAEGNCGIDQNGILGLNLFPFRS